jgi:hypothetical protein
LRSKKLDRNTSEIEELVKWFERLDNAVTRENYIALQKASNAFLFTKLKQERDGNKRVSPNEILYKYENNIFTRKQLIEFYQMLAYGNPLEMAKKYKRKMKCEFVRYSDLRLYVDKLRQSAERFFGY